MAVASEQYGKISFKKMLDGLREMYDREDAIISQVKKLRAEYNKLQEDKEMLQLMYMYACNRVSEKRK